MIKTIKSDVNEMLIVQTTNIVYSHLNGFCGIQYIPLRMSILRQRDCFEYDHAYCGKQPILLFLCGGSWISMDHNAWLPELTYFAKHGFTVVSVEYPVLASTRFSDQITSIQKAIDYLKANAAQYAIDPDRLFISGESAGGYLAAFFAAKNMDAQISGCISWYPPAAPVRADIPSLKDQGVTDMIPSEAGLPIDSFNYPYIPDLVTDKSAPILIIHGTDDSLVSPKNGEVIHEAWNKKGIHSEMLLIEHANHGDYRCFQTHIKEAITDFMNSI